MPPILPRPSPQEPSHREVQFPSRRRVFSQSQKEAILLQADLCKEPGEVGALLRREGIYSSYLTLWRRERAAGWHLTSRGRPPLQEKTALHIQKLMEEIASLKQENEKLQRILEIQKKMVNLLLPGNPPVKNPNNKS